GSIGSRSGRRARLPGRPEKPCTCAPGRQGRAPFTRAWVQRRGPRVRTQRVRTVSEKYRLACSYIGNYLMANEAIGMGKSERPDLSDCVAHVAQRQTAGAGRATTDG